MDDNPLFAIDEKGNLVEDWTKLTCSQQCLARVRIGDSTTGKYGYIDKTGKYAINPQFDVAGEVFVDGLTIVRTGDSVTGKWGYIDKTGKYVVNPQFDMAYGFMNDIAEVRIGDDKTGK